MPLARVSAAQVPVPMTAEQLRPHFEPFGNIEEVTIIFDKTTHQSKGCGFVTFSTEESARAAIDALSDKLNLVRPCHTLRAALLRGRPRPPWCCGCAGSHASPSLQPAPGGSGCAGLRAFSLRPAPRGRGATASRSGLHALPLDAGALPHVVAYAAEPKCQRLAEWQAPCRQVCRGVAATDGA